VKVYGLAMLLINTNVPFSSRSFCFFFFFFFLLFVGVVAFDMSEAKHAHWEYEEERTLLIGVAIFD
jgi:hypothetical protein